MHFASVINESVGGRQVASKGAQVNVDWSHPLREVDASETKEAIRI